MNPSSKWKLNLLDYGKAFILAVLTSVVGTVVSSATAGHLVTDPKTLLAYAISGASAYLMHAFTQDGPQAPISNDDFLAQIEGIVKPLAPVILPAAEAAITKAADLPVVDASPALNAEPAKEVPKTNTSGPEALR